MIYRRYGLSNSIARGFGYALGFALFSFVAGIVGGIASGIWVGTSKFRPVARWILRCALGVVLMVGILILLEAA